MTETEQMVLLKVISAELVGTSMLNMHDILYGSVKSCEASGKELRAVEKIMDAVPADIREQYNRSLRKTEADKLRAQAERLERGDEV